MTDPFSTRLTEESYPKQFNLNLTSIRGLYDSGLAMDLHPHDELKRPRYCDRIYTLINLQTSLTVRPTYSGSLLELTRVDTCSEDMVPATNLVVR